jgi:soluble cytochrome b562
MTEADVIAKNLEETKLDEQKEDVEEVRSVRNQWIRWCCM